MLVKNILFVWLILILINDERLEFFGIDANDDSTSIEPLLLITFGSGSNIHLDKPTSSFNFSTTKRQVFPCPTKDGMFSFTNKLCDDMSSWHGGTLDHTPDDGDQGYMYVINIGDDSDLLFNYTINDLSIGLSYKFSAYLASLNKIEADSSYVKPNIRFEVQTVSAEKEILALFNTGDIPQYETMTWSKYGLSFKASTSSVSLLMFSNVAANNGNDLAIDDIELRPGSTVCYPAMIIFPSKSSISSLIEYQFNDEIYITSILQPNCSESYTIHNQWTISHGSTVIKFNENIRTTSNDIYIPSKTLTYGLYQFKLTVITRASLDYMSSETIHINITRSSKIIVNLIQYGISEIILGQQQELLFEPKKYSFDGDGNTLIERNLSYQYYCRIYTNVNPQESFSDIQNSSCFSSQSNKTFWEYDTTKSSLKILSGSFQSNRSYQFKVEILKSSGYLLVHIQDKRSYRIAIGCVISTMCITDAEYQLINPTTQVALFSYCLENCTIETQIIWRIYQGIMDLSTNITQWSLFDPSILTFGNNTTHFTVTNELFLNNPTIEYWQFKVIYTFEDSTSSSSINFKKNSPPSHGYCTINPANGTITTLFNITCFNWTDDDGIKDYSYYAWTNDYTKRTIIGFSTISIFQTRLPRGNDINSLLHINVNIRDKFDCIQEYNMTSIYVYDDVKEIENLMNIILDSKEDLMTNNSLIQTLLTGNQNDIGPIITAASQQFNRMNGQNLENAVANGIPIASVSVSSLDDRPSSSSSNSIQINETIVEEYKKQLNDYANIREYLINFTTNLPIAGPNSILLQASSFVRLTESTNQLTRLTSLIAANKCYELAVSLNKTSHEIPYEDVQKAVNLLTQCTSNVLNVKLSGINGVLQQRINTLELDLLRANQLLDNNNNIFLEQMDLNQQNFYYQKQIANQISDKINKTLLLLTLAINNHLNLDQLYLINTSQILMFYEKLSKDSLLNKTIQYSEKFQINFPENILLNPDEDFLLRSKFEGLAPYGNYPSNTNFSRSLTVSLFDNNGNELNLNTSIELIIPRDQNLILPKMILQNVTNSNKTFSYKFINLTQLQPNPNLTISIHFQIQPINHTMAYLFIYQFDRTIQLNYLDGYKFFCPSNLTNENLYTYYIDNERLSKYKLMIFGLRELTSIEYEDICLNNSTQNFQIKNPNANFTLDYYLRIYTSGCYYLDQYNNWQSDGLLVGPKTNLYQTQCFTNHL